MENDKHTGGMKGMAMITDKLARVGMALVLTVGLMPVMAFAEGADGFEVGAGGADVDAASGVVAGAGAGSGSGEHAAYVEGEVLVAYSNEYSQAKVASLMETDRESTVSSLSESQKIISAEGNQVIVKAELKDGVSVEDAVSQMADDQRVAYVQPNYLYHLNDSVAVDEETAASATSDAATTSAAAASADSATGSAAEAIASATTASADATLLTTTVNDPYANNPTDSTAETNQWWLYSVNAFEAWDMSRCNNSVTVAILDTGINFEHEDLKNNIDTEHAYDAYAGKHMTESRTEEGAGHGTHVAGIVAAEANNGLDFAGASYNANILPINVFYYDSSQSEWYANTETLTEAYQYMKGLMDEGELTDLHVVNMSLGGYGSMDADDYALRTEISAMNERGVMTVCAGGNGDSYGNPRTDKSYPGDYDECVSVVALQSSNVRAAWSDYNSCKDISAPGVNIFSTWINGESATKKASGTSMASPLVAGCVALLFASNPNLSVDDAKGIMYSTAQDLGDSGWDQYYGWGKIDAAAMLQSLRGAEISCDTDEVYVTQQAKFSAKLFTNMDDDPAEGCDWVWSIDKPEVASIAEDGTLTALKEGTVRVTVTSSVDEKVKGSKTITIKPIAMPDGVSAEATDNVVKVSWLSAPAAVGYDVYRAVGAVSSGAWEKIGTVAATDAASYEFADSNVEVSKPYYYYVAPYGTLDGEAVYGKSSDSVVTMFKTTVMEYAGDTRYDTMASTVDMYAAERALEDSAIRTVIVTSGTSFPDALAASGLAGTQSCPIVTTNANELSEAAAKEIASINPKRILVIGGEAAVSAEVVDEIKEICSAAVRRVSGNTRYETATKIYDEGRGSWGKTAFVASGSEGKFADSLSASPYLYASNSPLFLVDTNSASGLSASVLQRLRSGDFDRVVIIGGTASVSEVVEKQLTRLGIANERWSGDNRYATSQVVAAHAISEGVLSASEIGVATGAAPWDALVSGPLLGMQGNPLVLMEDSEDGLVAAGDKGIIADSKCVVGRLSFFGGVGALPQTVRDVATSAAGL